GPSDRSAKSRQAIAPKTRTPAEGIPAVFVSKNPTYRAPIVGNGYSAGLMLAVLALTSGCRNIASSSLNAEGVQLYQQGNYQQASDRFQQAISKDPNSAGGYYNLAAALHKTGTLYNRPNDLRQAELLYNQCLERDPNHGECYRGLAVLLTETNRSTDAVQLLESWSVSNSTSPEPKIELARLYEEFGQVELAKTKLVEALAGDPHNARALTALGRLRDQQGDHVQALANYQRSLQINRFQPQVSSRVAALQGALNGPVVPAQPVPGGTQIAQPWQPAVRF
ncbi:MAG: tetratricopeptide repeat protein, partial [Gammaproteobacteria bacterium]|nr:tetratricopeptide repeat protein [Gammaproteobacteria bacterium]